MNTLKNGLILAFSVLFLIACGSSSAENKTQEEAILYHYDHNKTVMEWTAYKFESKAPVKGTFTTINVSSLSESNDPKELVESFGFTIPVNSISTMDDSRDAKIIEFFFGVLSTSELSGRILSLDENKQARLEVSMHGITDVVQGNYTLEGTHFSFKGTMDLTKWNTAQAIDILNENCKENHTENGVTKMWSEVDLSFTTQLASTK